MAFVHLKKWIYLKNIITIEEAQIHVHAHTYRHFTPIRYRQMTDIWGQSQDNASLGLR